MGKEAMVLRTREALTRWRGARLSATRRSNTFSIVKVAQAVASSFYSTRARISSHCAYVRSNVRQCVTHLHRLRGTSRSLKFLTRVEACGRPCRMSQFSVRYAAPMTNTSAYRNKPEMAIALRCDSRCWHREKKQCPRDARRSNACLSLAVRLETRCPILFSRSRCSRYRLSDVAAIWFGRISRKKEPETWWRNWCLHCLEISLLVFLFTVTQLRSCWLL